MTQKRKSATIPKENSAPKQEQQQVDTNAPKAVIMPAELVQNVLNYLGKQTYVDVRQMIEGIEKNGIVVTYDQVKHLVNPQ